MCVTPDFEAPEHFEAGSWRLLRSGAIVTIRKPSQHFTNAEADSNWSSRTMLFSFDFSSVYVRNLPSLSTSTFMITPWLVLASLVVVQSLILSDLPPRRSMLELLSVQITLVRVPAAAATSVSLWLH